MSILQLLLQTAIVSCYSNMEGSYICPNEVVSVEDLISSEHDDKLCHKSLQ